jgi:hypothetical protein
MPPPAPVHPGEECRISLRLSSAAAPVLPPALEAKSLDSLDVPKSLDSLDVPKASLDDAKSGSVSPSTVRAPRGVASRPYLTSARRSTLRRPRLPSGA